jgi:hypothetical protein
MDFNVVIDNEHLEDNKDLLPILFGENTSLSTFEANDDMFTVLVDFGLFSSRSEAKKNWVRTGRDIPEGWSAFEGIGKKKHNLYIFKPI